ncbi:ABC transporter permease [Goodfellowiella coeruleoviolacea]|uniref:Spermidine/putrescine transport system permease protein n=1 Tax=Goodfellowiella coeruleoviolacea TaxID=334858 RepID=A0AAE3KE78_9PSEU|nr:ABC transporter permease [Goodfellowiella coeruleoviolacea]MCP2163642.1 putative spermidine/putrescine transport system permease protein [Goodfellowiella coeruleoviolacea]
MRRRPVLWGLAALALLFLLGPILLMVPVAFSSGDTIEFPPPGLSTRWFEQALDYQPFLDALRTSLLVAGGATLLALLIGVPATLVIQRYRFPGRKAIETLFLSPVIVPELVLGFALFQQLMVTLRITALGALLIGHTVLLLPYAVRVTGASLAMSDPALEEAARGLGAGPVRAFFRITLPVMTPGIVAASVLSLLTSFNNVPLSLLLTGPGMSTLPVEMLRYVEFSFDPVVAAVSTLLLGITVVVALVTERLVGFNKVFSQ